LQNFNFTEFVKNVAIAYDGLIELSDLSLLLQKRDVIITEADKTMKGTIRTLESMASSPGSHAEEVSEAVGKNTFKDTEIHTNSKIIQINMGQFYRSLA
jgi:hypothetical protein